MRLWRRRRSQLRCQLCGQPGVEWPRFFTQAFYDEHTCPFGRGHVYGLPKDALWKLGGV